MSDYQIDFEHKGKDYSVGAVLAFPGSAYEVPQRHDDPGGLEVTREPYFDMTFYTYSEYVEDWVREDDPCEEVCKKAEEILQEIYWDRYLDGVA